MLIGFERSDNMIIELVGNKIVRRKKRKHVQLPVAMYTGTDKLRGVVLEDLGGRPYRVKLGG